MIRGKREGVLLERAGVEEKGYNWVEAARLYDEFSYIVDFWISRMDGGAW